MRVVALAMGLMLAAALAGCASQPPDAAAPAAATPAAAVAPASESTSASPPAKAQAEMMNASNTTAEDPVVCRNEKTLGTRLSKRVCKTLSQRRADEAAAREMMRNRDKKSHGVTDGSTGGG